MKKDESRNVWSTRINKLTSTPGTTLIFFFFFLGRQLRVKAKFDFRRGGGRNIDVLLSASFVFREGNSTGLAAATPLDRNAISHKSFPRLSNRRVFFTAVPRRPWFRTSWKFFTRDFRVSLSSRGESFHRCRCLSYLLPFKISSVRI